jgi:hypothetical protein
VKAGERLDQVLDSCVAPLSEGGALLVSDHEDKRKCCEGEDTTPSDEVADGKQ